VPAAPVALLAPVARAALAVTLAAALPACGGDDDTSVPLAPALIPGGGVHDPGIDGVVNVFVIDADDDTPLADAAVKVGDVEGTTDASGLFVATGPALTGPQAIYARAAGHATAGWLGVDGGNVTIPLARSPADTARPPQAQLTGTIAGWDTLPSPDLNHTRIAIVSYSQDPVLGARGNDLRQPPPVGTLPAASCARPRGPATTCAWKLNARPGDLALGLIMFDFDNRGTANTGDDSMIITGYSLQRLTVVAGVNQSDLALPLPAADSVAQPTLDLGTPPAALTERNAIVGLDLGAAGVWRDGGANATRIGVVVPSLSIAPGSSYEVIAIAREPIADGTAAESVTIERGQTNVDALTAGTWLEPPAAVTADRTMVSFTRSGSGIHAVELTNAGLGVEGRLVYSLALFDGAAQVALPTAFSPLPTDPMTVKVTALATGEPVAVGDFELDDVSANLTAAASDTVALP
jgi:hypothetical protein